MIAARRPLDQIGERRGETRPAPDRRARPRTGEALPPIIGPEDRRRQSQADMQSDSEH